MSSVDVGGDHDALQRLDATEHVAGDLDRVRALALGDRNGHGRQRFPGRRVHHANVFGGFRAAIGDFRHVAHEHRFVAGDSDDHVANVFGGAQKLAGFQKVFAIFRVELARRQASIGKSQRSGDLQGGHSIARESGRIQHDAYFAPLTADQGNGGYIRHLFDGVIELRGDAAQIEIVVAAAGEREREDRHIVDGARLDERLRCARRDEVEIGEQLLIQADDALLFVLADVETHDGERPRRDWTWSRCTRRPGSPRAVFPSAW